MKYAGPFLSSASTDCTSLPFFFLFFPLVSGSAKTLYNIDTQLLYIQFARFPRSPRNTGFSPRGFSSALPSTQARGVITTGSGFICAYEPSVFASTFLYFSRFSFFPLPRRMLPASPPPCTSFYPAFMLLPCTWDGLFSKYFVLFSKVTMLGNTLDETFIVSCF